MDKSEIMSAAHATATVAKTNGIKAGKEFLQNLFADESANMGAVFSVMSLIVISILLYVSIVVLQGVSDSASLKSGDEFYNASQSVTTGTQNALSMSTVLLIVIVAVAILAALFGIFVILRPRGGE